MFDIHLSRVRGFSASLINVEIEFIYPAAASEKGLRGLVGREKLLYMTFSIVRFLKYKIGNEMMIYFVKNISGTV